ncbi:MAG: CPBP family intramembrane metalloprotease [Thermoanaerobaculia bacterium]|jgi:CAAX amino terminal protease family.|nr:CPBP family intramembrane metalloprotease [Thermoanaerobaculia bacterium]
MTDSPSPLPEAAPRGGRLLSAAELLLGAGLVLGHNVWRLLPNEVPVLFVLGLASYRLRNGGFSTIGFQRPPSWTRLLAIALGAAALRIALGIVVEPLAESVWPPIVAPAGTEAIASNPWTALRWLGLVWTWAAFGEEIGYRGWILGRAADALGRSPAALAFAVIASSVLFGFGHFYKGPAGILDSGLAGLVLASAFLLARRNLWAPILAHGFIDTFGIAALFFGWAD